MDKLSKILELILQRGEMNIYRRILRTALWGSCVTFVVMGGIFLISMLVLHIEFHHEAKGFSVQMGDYLEKAVTEDVKDRLTDTTVLRARLVGRILDGCALSVESLADTLTDTLQHEGEYVPKELPVANYDEVASYEPYVYYTAELIEHGITPELRQEINYVSSIEDDIRRISKRYQGCILAASDKGYLIRIDMIDLDGKGAVLCQEPMRSTYGFKHKEWYQSAIKSDKMIFTKPYMASYNRPCLSIGVPYHDMVGIAGVVVADIDTEYICQRMSSSDVDGSDFSFIMDHDGNVIISPRKEGSFAATDMNNNLRKADDQALVETTERMIAGEQGIALVKVDGGEYYLAYAPVPDVGWSVGTVIKTAEITVAGDKTEAYVNKVFENYDMKLVGFFLIKAIGAILLFILTLYIILRKNVDMARGFAEPIDTLIDGVKEIAAGNLDRKLSIKTGDELETLADSVNHMSHELTLYMERLAKTTAQKEHIETELSVATRIQTGMLPDGHNPFPNRHDLDLAAIMQPAREVGGDFYDFYFLDEHHLVVTVADVSGKGVPAALFMVIAKTLLKENLLFAGEPDRLGQVFYETNNALIRSNKESMFVTVFCGVLDTITGEFVYVNAGHNPPIIRKKERRSYMEMAHYPVLGALDDISYDVTKLKLDQGDAIFLYTDGITEAMNVERKFFGNQRLLKIMASICDSAKQDIETVYEAVKEFTGEAAQSDDITMLELIYFGRAEERKENYENG